MDVKNELKIFAPKVTEEILNIIEDERKRTDGKYEHIDEMWRYVINLVQSGKRLRGAFLYYAYIMCKNLCIYLISMIQIGAIIYHGPHLLVSSCMIVLHTGKDRFDSSLFAGQGVSMFGFNLP
jgi:hypothetical protein